MLAQEMENVHASKSRSLNESQLAEFFSREPTEVLEELLHRIGQVYSESPGMLVQKISNILTVLEKASWPELSEPDFARFTRILIQAATMSPSVLPLVFRVVLEEAAGKRTTRCECLLEQFLKFVPASLPVLVTSLEFYFPHHSRPQEQIYNYSEMLTCLLRMVPALRSRIIDMMIDKFLTIDVAIQLEATNLPDALELVEEEGTDNDSEGSTVETPEKQLKVMEEYEVMDSDLLRRASSPIALNMVEMMGKLDSSLGLLFDFFKTCQSEEIKLIFSHLLQTFERTILPTFRSRSVPFLIFYASSLDSSLPDVFLGFLMKRLYHIFDDPADGKKKSTASTASLLTVLTASYIGSYVSRARFLPDNLVRLSFDMLLTWSLRFIGDLPNHMRSGRSVKALRAGTNLVSERVAVFYAVSQAIMYIFCFRHKILIQDAPNRHEALTNYRNFILPILQSSLNPLKWCMSSVVEEFVRLSEFYDLIDCRQILEKSSRRSAPPAKTFESNEMISEEAFGPRVTDKTGSFLGDLDSYFPFDPLILTSCSSFISSDIYLGWQAVQEEIDEVSEESDSIDTDADEPSGDVTNIIHKELLQCNPAWQSLAIRKLV